MEPEESQTTKRAGSLKEEQPTSDDTSVHGAGTELYIDPVKEAKLVAKLDLAFTPIIMLLYLVCFFDRSNIGNVKVAGIMEDIGGGDKEFTIAVSIFYATYVAFETPGSVLMKIITPRVMLSGLCTVWSLTTVFTGFIQNVGGLYATRLILGACEAGLFPCLNLYLTMVYRREEQAKRVAYLFCCTALAGAFGGLLAYGLLNMDGLSGYEGWSLVCAVIAWVGLPNDPANAYFLNDEEKEMMRIRNVQRKAYLGSDEFSWEEIRIAAVDTKLHLSALIQFCEDILLYGFSTFLPSILYEMDYSTLESNYLTIPVYIFGAIVFLSAAWVSDRYEIRGPIIFVTNVFGMIGYILLLAVDINGVKYFATFLCAIAVYTGPGLNVTWLNVNIAPHYRRAASIGLQQTIGNTAGIVAGQIYREVPYYLGNGFSLGALFFGQFLIAAKIFYVRKQNTMKTKIESGEIPDTRKIKTGDRELDFKYHI